MGRANEKSKREKMAEREAAEEQLRAQREKKKRQNAKDRESSISKTALSYSMLYSNCRGVDLRRRKSVRRERTNLNKLRSTFVTMYHAYT